MFGEDKTVGDKPHAARMLGRPNNQLHIHTFFAQAATN